LAAAALVLVLDGPGGFFTAPAAALSAGGVALPAVFLVVFVVVFLAPDASSAGFAAGFFGGGAGAAGLGGMTGDRGRASSVGRQVLGKSQQSRQTPREESMPTAQMKSKPKK
jgi:hypothetical protein